MDEGEVITIQHSGRPKGDKKNEGDCEVLPWCTGRWELRSKRGDDCGGVNRLNDG